MALHLFHIETLNQIKTFDAYSIKKHVIEKVSLFSPVAIGTQLRLGLIAVINLTAES